MKEVKSQLDVLNLITDILKQMREANANGIKGVSYYIDNVELCGLFKIFEQLKTKNNDVRLFFIGESFNAETIDISYRVLPGYHINISSVPQKVLKPKINLVNYN